MTLEEKELEIKKNKAYNLLKMNPKMFYMYYIVKKDQSELPRFEDLVRTETDLRELLNYNILFGSKNDEDHKYNLFKNTFWNKSGLNKMLKRELGL